jgi:hypothetical protein
MWRSRCSTCDKAIRGRAPLFAHPRLCARDHVAHVTHTFQYSTHPNKVPKVPKGKSPTIISLELKDLPQGLLPCKSFNAASQDDVPTYPTVILQARSNMRKFGNCVLLTRVGGFYELYFEHAEELGPLLNLKVAQKRTNAGPVSMVYHPDR